MQLKLEERFVFVNVRLTITFSMRTVCVKAEIVCFVIRGKSVSLRIVQYATRNSINENELSVLHSLDSPVVGMIVIYCFHIITYFDELLET